MKINPKNFGIRRLYKLPPHFAKMSLPMLSDYQLQKLSRWIYANCSGRFALVKQVQLNSNENDIQTVIMLGFEEPSDLTLFVLSGMTQIA